MKKGKSSRTLEDLDSRIREARDKVEDNRPARETQTKSMGSGLGFAFRVASELVGGLIFGVLVGLFLDNWLDTGPVFLLLFLVLGMSAGVWNVYRLSNRAGSAVGFGAVTDAHQPVRRQNEVEETEPPAQEAGPTEEDPRGKPH